MLTIHIHLSTFYCAILVLAFAALAFSCRYLYLLLIAYRTMQRAGLYAISTRTVVARRMVASAMLRLILSVLAMIASASGLVISAFIEIDRTVPLDQHFYILSVVFFTAVVAGMCVFSIWDVMEFRWRNKTMLDTRHTDVVN